MRHAIRSLSRWPEPYRRFALSLILVAQFLAQPTPANPTNDQITLMAIADFCRMRHFQFCLFITTRSFQNDALADEVGSEATLDLQHLSL